MLSKQLLDVIACTKCKGDLDYDKKRNILVCSKCRLKYKVLKDIPDMMLEDAEKF
ncbi:MAG: Trm112 family protein [Candidatus Aenigmarchaeota archaeon]|nr:Trm112 family protein [Candidatus Aenigmarchaeota archaeon]